MKHEYSKIIQEFDKTLDFLRNQWQNASWLHKEAWVQRLNGALDERLRLMKLRDS